jgi:thiol:disulfide interchange protein
MHWTRKSIAAFYIVLVALLARGLAALALQPLDLAKPPGLGMRAADESPVSARLASDASSIIPGKPFSIGVLLKMAPGWHTYYREPGDSGMATEIQWELPEGFTVGELQWPTPIQETEAGSFKVNIYKDEVLLFASVTPPAQISGSEVSLRAKVSWLVCKESCIPGKTEVALTLPISQSTSAGQGQIANPASADAPLFEKFRGLTTLKSLEKAGDRAKAAEPAKNPVIDYVLAQPEEPKFWHFLLFAFLGGLILNVMPCVLPVISLKILGFVQHGDQSRGRIRLLGLTYALGVVCSFLLLAGVVIATQKAGRLAGWGMQFQNPVFVVAITTLVTLVSLNLFGIFEVTLSSTSLSVASGLASKEGLAGAFFNGVFAVILATPCTAPFLGAALGYAFVQPPLVVALFFLTVAAGLAFPYVVLCWTPGLLRFLPKPGAWMERFKIAMGFPMLATAVWLYSVAMRHYGSDSLWLGLFLVCLGFGAWIYGEFVQRGRSHRGLAAGIAVLLVVGGYGFALESRLHWRHPAPVAGTLPGAGAAVGEGIDWQAWSEKAVQETRAQGHPALVDFTADWCLTCQTNKATSLEIPSVRQALKQGGFKAFVGDFTRSDDAIAQEIQKFGRAGVPLVLVYPVQGQPIILPELLTPGIVLEALQRADGK